MNKFFIFFTVLVVADFGVGLLLARSTKEPIDMSSITAVIDVRTPQEAATGYLEGALLFDVQGVNFAAQIETLDKSLNYVVYCRSGMRAGQAICYMKKVGFTGALINAGSIANAAFVTGLKIVGTKKFLAYFKRIY